MKNLIQKLANESKQPERVVAVMMEGVARNLLREGCDEDDPRFLPYLVRRTRKRLKIQESTTYKTFREFFNNKEK